MNNTKRFDLTNTSPAHPYPLRLLLRQGFQLFDLLDEVGLLIIELLIVLAVVVELGQEVDQLVLIPEQDVQDRLRLVRVGDKHLSVKKSAAL